MADMGTDIYFALMNVRAAFEEHNVPCPDFLLYDDPDKAYRAMRILYEEGVAVRETMIGAGAPHDAQIGPFTLRFFPQIFERAGRVFETESRD